jgi:hypothetical protein
MQSVKSQRTYSSETSIDLNGLHGVISQKMELFSTKPIILMKDTEC